MTNQEQTEDIQDMYNRFKEELTTATGKMVTYYEYCILWCLERGAKDEQAAGD